MSEQETECLSPVEHTYRLVKCENDRDTYRCEKCGREYECACDFDEEYS